MAVGVTASTGMAAVNIGGMTLHFFAGFPGDISKHSFTNVKKKIMRNAGAKERWERVRVLVIDESKLFSRKMCGFC